jgi:hypothetical protein
MGLTATVPFDDRYNRESSVADLSTRLMQEFLDDIGSGFAPLDIEHLRGYALAVPGPTEAASIG